MIYNSKSVQIRVSPVERDAFTAEYYRPGIISPARVIRGSIGAGLTLALIAFLSIKTGVAVLYPPLAASCFIVAVCPYLRVARPKPVIVGHFIASLCGVFGAWAGGMLGGGYEYAVMFKLGISVLLASILMQIFDVDHPPAAATAAIPSILPPPVEWYVLPFNMVWGATIIVVFSLIWNRCWFEFPVKDAGNQKYTAGLCMEKSQLFGCLFCVVGSLALSFGPAHSSLEFLGIAFMLPGVFFLGCHHYFFLQEIPKTGGLEISE